MFFHKKGMTRIFLSMALATLLSMLAAPGFAGLQNEPLPFSRNLRSIFLNQTLKTCVIGNFETFDPVPVASPPHTWWLRVPGPNTLRVSVAAFAVNPAAESGSILAKLFTEAGQEVGKVEVLHPTGAGLPAGASAVGTISTEVTTGAATFRLEVRHGPATVSNTREARHYVLQLDAGDTPDQIMLAISHGPKYFEPGFQVFHVNPDLNQPFTLIIVNDQQSPSPGTIEIFDAGDNQDQLVFSGGWTKDDLSKTFTLESAPRTSLLVAIRTNGHYSLDVPGGSDHGIYLDDCPPQGNVAPTVVLDSFPAINFVGGEAFLGRKGVEQSHSASAADPNGGDLTFEWSFGRETTYLNTFRATDQASVTFATPGVHRVRVRVTDDKGASATAGLREVVVDSFACTRGSGFWKQQLADGDSKKIDDATLQAYLDILHITSRLFSDITLEQAQAILNEGQGSGSTMRAKAKAQALAAWLNFARGAIALDERFWVEMTAADGSRRPRKIFAEAMIEVEAILSNPNATKNELARAKDIAEAANQSDSDDPVCMADPDRELFTQPTIQLNIVYFSCGGGEGIYLRPRNGSGATYVVDDDSTAALLLTQINLALLLTSDGDLIYVCPGTYRGDFSVTTNISIISLAGADETIIQGYDGSTTPDTASYNVELQAGGLLQGFTIQGGVEHTCTSEGGGVLVTDRARKGISAVIRQNKIMHNENCFGAGVNILITSLATGSVTVENNIIAYNTVVKNGGAGIYVDSSYPATIVNNVIAYNTPGSGEFPGHQDAGGIGVFGGTVDIRNNILYCNTSQPSYNVISVASGASATIEYNNSFGNADTTGASQDYTGGTGNTNSDPFLGASCLTGSSRVDFRLPSSSPSIDAGDPDSAYNDVDGTRNDHGTYGGPNGDW